MPSGELNENIGRATFLPLNKLEKGRMDARPNHPGVIDYALNLVEFDSRFLPAFWYVFITIILQRSSPLVPNVCLIEENRRSIR
jgi:chromosome segregation ATPase